MSFIQAVANFYRRYAETVVGISYFLRDDLPADAPGIGKFAQEVGRRACRQYARNRENFGIIAYDPIWSDSCDSYLNSINEGPTSGGSYAPPFTGGQCSFAYKISYAIPVSYAPPSNQPDEIFTGGSVGTNKYPIGPILGISMKPSTPNSGCGLLPHLQVTVTTATGDYGFGCFRNPPPAGGLIPGTPYFTSIVPLNQSSVDNCGNPPNQYQPPQYPPNLPTLPPPTNPGPGFGNNWDVNLNPDGTFEICIAGECSDPIPPGPDDNPPGNPSEDPGEPDGSPKANNPSNPSDITIEGCAGTGRILTGIKINFTQIPPAVSGPLDYYRNVCFAGFGPDLNLIDLVVDGKLLKNGQFVIPDSEFCRCYRVVVSPGWGLSVQAYSRPEKTE